MPHPTPHHPGSDDAATVAVPQPDALWYPDIVRFALSYDAYRHPTFGTALDVLAERTVEAWRSEGTLPDTATELRACLFFEQRRWAISAWPHPARNSSTSAR